MAAARPLPIDATPRPHHLRLYKARPTPPGLCASFTTRFARNLRSKLIIYPRRAARHGHDHEQPPHCGPPAGHTARAGRGVPLLPDADAATAAAAAEGEAAAVVHAVPSPALLAVDADGKVPREHAEAAGVRGRAQRPRARRHRDQGKRHLLPAALRRGRPRRRALPLHHHQGQGAQRQRRAPRRHLGARQRVRQARALQLHVPVIKPILIIICICVPL